MVENLGEMLRRIAQAKCRSIEGRLHSPVPVLTLDRLYRARSVSFRFVLRPRFSWTRIEDLMSKEVAGMVQSRRVKGAGSARPESALSDAQLLAAIRTDLARRGGPRNSDRLLRWDPDHREGVWNVPKETELPG